MILTVTPNAAVDKTYRVEDFRLDHVNRPSATFTVAGGKGINVARVFATLGGDAVATGFLGGINGKIVARALAHEPTEDAFVRVAGESRVCIAIIDPTTGSQTEVNEPGPSISAAAVRRLYARFERLLYERRFDFVVLSGSLPPDAPPALYAELIERSRRSGVRCVLDTSGEALRQALAARPWMVKPNRAELEQLFQRPVAGLDGAMCAARELLDRGVTIIALTRGAEGALLMTGSGAWHAAPPAIDFASAVASGDSFVAAFLWEWQHGSHPGDPASALRLATGAGAANAAVVGAGFCSRESIHALAERAEVRRLDPAAS